MTATAAASSSTTSSSTPSHNAPEAVVIGGDLLHASRRSGIKATIPTEVKSTAAQDDGKCISAEFKYETTIVTQDDQKCLTVTPKSYNIKFTTDKIVPRTGVLIVGIGGNNGSTLLAGIEANRNGLKWNTKEGVQEANYYGSVSMCATTRIGLDEMSNSDVYVPIRSLLPMLHPNDMVIYGWDISKAAMGDAMKRAAVIDYDLQRQLVDKLNTIIPLPGIYDPTFIATNQGERADNLIEGSKFQQMEIIRGHIRDFKKNNNLENVIVVWSANTERFAQHQPGVHDSETGLLKAIHDNHPEISPSCIFAMAAILEKCSYINGSPQNTICNGLVEMARRQGVFLIGDDLKTGQTKLKSVLVDFLVSAGIKPTAVCSYNHLGNNDGLNLSSPQQFRSKEVSKASVVDDMLCQAPTLYGEGEKPDHVIVIKYVPAVGDSKRALDEYTSKIFMNGQNTIVIHNTCEDSLLATPVILDLIIFCEFCQRVKVNVEGNNVSLEPLLSLLSYWCKAPVVPERAPVVNALFAQREAIVNFMKACLGLPATNYLNLEHRLSHWV